MTVYDSTPLAPTVHRAGRLADVGGRRDTVNYGESVEKVQQFVRNVPIDLPILLDRHTEAAKAWQVRILPTSFVLGQDGQIRYGAVGLLDWGEAQVVKLIAALAPRP